MNVGAPVASALSFFVFNSRQINLEAGSAVGFAIHPDVAAALFHNSVYRRETKSSSLSFFLRRKEGFENVRLRFGVHTAAIVGNREHYVFAGRQHGRGPRIGGIQIDIRSLDCQATALRHRVARINGEIQDHLLDLAAVGLDQAHVGSGRGLQLNVLADQPSQNSLHVHKNALNADYFGRQHLFSTESKQLARERGGPLRGRLDLFRVTPQRIAGGQTIREQICVALDNHQEIVEIVSNSSRQSSDCFHFLRLAKLLLQLSAVRDVKRHANRALQLAAGVAQGLDMARVRSAFPFDMEGGRFPRHCATMSRDRLETLIGRLKIFRQRHSNHLILL